MNDEIEKKLDAVHNLLHGDAQYRALRGDAGPINHPMTEQTTASVRRILNSVVPLLRSLQESLTAEDRVALWNEIREDYCHECGTQYLPCYCTRDD